MDWNHGVIVWDLDCSMNVPLSCLTLLLLIVVLLTASHWLLLGFPSLGARMENVNDIKT